MIDPKNCLSALFSSRQHYLNRTIQANNQMHTFPLRTTLLPEKYLERLGSCPLLISGGTEEERGVILGDALSRAPAGTRRVVLHGGNRTLKPGVLNRKGLSAAAWTWDLLAGMTPVQQLAMLTEDGRDRELVPFWALALEICRTLGEPITLDSLAGLDWLGGSWQLRLFREVERNTALDLLRRYDAGMATRAAQAAARLEVLRRASGSGPASGLPAAGSATIWSAEIHGGSEALARHRLDLLLDGVERGESLVLAVDGLTLRHPLLERPIPGVRLLRSAPDLFALPGGPEALPVQGCGVVLLRHTAYGSAERLSAHFFGTYECLVTETSTGYQKRSAGLLPEVRNIGMSVRRQRELRLAPRILTMLPAGTACAALPDGWEGLLRLEF